MNTYSKKRTNTSKPFANRMSKNNRQNSNKKKASSINPSLLVNKSTNIVPEKYQTSRSFNDFAIDNRLIECLTKKGYCTPTEIQDKSIESQIQGQNILGIAQTGTGKTGAFLIPIINNILKTNQKEVALIVVPTRELALQVQEEARSMTKNLGIYSSCFIGGTNINKDLQQLRRPSHIIIGTPGRLLDLVNRRILNLKPFNKLVLDEFDRMLDMGFVNDVKKIISLMPNRNQTMLFSATLDKKQQTIIDEVLTNPIIVKVSSGDTSADHIDQDVIKITQGEDKFDILCNLLQKDEFDRIIIFDETKHQVNKLSKKLNKAGIKAEEIHGNKSQSARQNALNSFKQGKVKVLVATDVAARGIDVSNISLVINYQMPTSYDSYIHRVGRTGRAGKSGKALTFIG